MYSFRFHINYRIDISNTLKIHDLFIGYFLREFKSTLKILINLESFEKEDILSSILIQGFQIDWVKNIDNQWYTFDMFYYYIQEH